MSGNCTVPSADTRVWVVSEGSLKMLISTMSEAARM